MSERDALGLDRYGQLPYDAREVVCHCGHHASEHGWARAGECTPCEGGEDTSRRTCSCNYFRPKAPPIGAFVNEAYANATHKPTP